MVVNKSQQEGRQEDKLFNHVDLVHMLDLVDLENGTAVAGGSQGTTKMGPWLHSTAALILLAGITLSCRAWVSP